jgi:hypothetical protein
LYTDFGFDIGMENDSIVLDDDEGIQTVDALAESTKIKV